MFSLDLAAGIHQITSKSTKNITRNKLVHIRFLVDGLQLSSSYKKSSIWLGIKPLWSTLLSNIRWLVGDGSSIRFWKDNWLGEIMVQSCHIDFDYLDLLNDKVSSFISDGAWALPSSFQRAHPEVSKAISSISLPLDSVPDQVIWASSSLGTLSSSYAYIALSHPFPTVPWGNRLWHASIQPRKSLASWKIIQNRVLVDERLQRLNVQLCSWCYLLM